MEFVTSCAAAEMIEGICINLVKQDKAQRLPDEKPMLIDLEHDGRQKKPNGCIDHSNSTFYTKVYRPYNIFVNRELAFLPNKIPIKFWYDKRTITTPDGKRIPKDQAGIKISTEGLKLLLTNISIGGMLIQLGMKFVDKNGTVNIDAMSEIIRKAISLIDKEANVEIIEK